MSGGCVGGHDWRPGAVTLGVRTCTRCGAVARASRDNHVCPYSPPCKAVFGPACSRLAKDARRMDYPRSDVPASRFRCEPCPDHPGAEFWQDEDGPLCCDICRTPLIPFRNAFELPRGALDLPEEVAPFSPRALDAIAAEVFRPVDLEVIAKQATLRELEKIVEDVRVVCVTGVPHCMGCGRAAMPRVDFDPAEVRDGEHTLRHWREVGPLHAVCPPCRAMPWAFEIAKAWAAR